MPILDGYRATHTIRTQEPFKSSSYIRKIPIVAMTASAIQGDREKCKRAGMDDYLAKPVKPKLLEQKLVKWALEAKRKKAAMQKQASADMSLVKSQEPSTPNDSSETFSDEPDPPRRGHNRGVDSLTRHLSDRLNSIDFANQNALKRSGGTENDRTVSRAAAEEKASSLRDDKLLSMTENPRHQNHPMSAKEKGEARELGVSNALTKENMDLLAEQQEKEDEVAQERITRAETGGHFKQHLRSKSSDNSPSPSSRPAARRFESERTVTPRDSRRKG